MVLRPQVASPIDADSQDEWVPVLLDFGLTKRLPDKLRLAFALMVASAETMDFGAVLEAFDDMGLELGGSNVSEDIENLKYMFRDAAPADEARKRNAVRSIHVSIAATPNGLLLASGTRESTQSKA